MMDLVQAAKVRATALRSGRPDSAIMRDAMDVSLDVLMERYGVGHMDVADAIDSVPLANRYADREIELRAAAHRAYAGSAA
jgi:hypothetical protein